MSTYRLMHPDSPTIVEVELIKGLPVSTYYIQYFIIQRLPTTSTACIAN